MAAQNIMAAHNMKRGMDMIWEGLALLHNGHVPAFTSRAGGGGKQLRTRWSHDKRNPKKVVKSRKSKRLPAMKSAKQRKGVKTKKAR